MTSGAHPIARPNQGTAAFFGLAFALTWGLQVPALAARQGWLAGPPEAYLAMAMLGVLGPMVAATWLCARAGGRPAVAKLFSGLLRWRASWPQYGVALVVPGALLTAALLLCRAFGYAGPVVLFPEPERLGVALIVAFGEEVGWRGYALPRLQARHGAFVASGLLGLLWMIWHIPMFVGQGVPMTVLPWMLLFFVGGSLVFTWLFNRGGGSLALVVLAHFAVHCNNSHAALPDNIVPLAFHSLVYVALGLAVALLDRKTFPELGKPVLRQPPRSCNA